MLNQFRIRYNNRKAIQCRRHPDIAVADRLVIRFAGKPRNYIDRPIRKYTNGYIDMNIYRPSLIGAASAFLWRCNSDEIIPAAEELFPVEYTFVNASANQLHTVNLTAQTHFPKEQTTNIR